MVCRGPASSQSEVLVLEVVLGIGVFPPPRRALISLEFSLGGLLRFLQQSTVDEADILGRGGSLAQNSLYCFRAQMITLTFQSYLKHFPPSYTYSYTP